MIAYLSNGCCTDFGNTVGQEIEGVNEEEAKGDEHDLLLHTNA